MADQVKFTISVEILKKIDINQIKEKIMDKNSKGQTLKLLPELRCWQRWLPNRWRYY